MKLIMCTNDKSNGSKSFSGTVVNLDFQSSENAPSSEIIKSQTILQLENSEESLFTQIDKAIFKNDKIYILDVSGQYHVYVFDLNGKFLKRIGNRIRGPGEYRFLCDFDVADDGFVYLYDRQKKQMFIYKESGELVEAFKMPFRADAFYKIKNGYLFSMAINNESEAVGSTKVVLTDNSFKIIKKYFNYREGYKDDKGNNGLFVKSNRGILYNKPVNDSVFVFDEHDGGLKSCFRVDFGKKSIPNQLTNSYVEILDSRKENDYSYMYTMPYIIGDYLIGNIISMNNKEVVCYDLKNNKSYIDAINPKKITHKNLNFPVGIIGDSVVVSFMDSQMYSVDVDKNELDKSTSDHIKNGGVILILNNISRNKVKE